MHNWINETLTTNSDVWYFVRALFHQVLPLRACVDLGAMALKGYSAFPRAPALLEYHDQIV